MVLGLTGKYCAGKNLIARLLSQRGWFVVDEDEVGHEALVVRKRQIIDAFGRRIVGPDGAIDRRSLGRIVFSDPDALGSLESIVHPWMVSKTRRLIEAEHSDNAAVNAAILFKMGLHEFCEVTIVVRAHPFVRYA